MKKHSTLENTICCEICGSDGFVDAHHYDCREGKFSSATINLCRRCHRTYHDRGIEWFDDDKIDKAIEIENRRREIWYEKLTRPERKLVLLERGDIQRSDYWNKIHGIVKRRQLPKETVSERQLGFGLIDDYISRSNSEAF